MPARFLSIYLHAYCKGKRINKHIFVWKGELKQ